MQNGVIENMESVDDVIKTSGPAALRSLAQRLFGSPAACLGVAAASTLAAGFVAHRVYHLTQAARNKHRRLGYGDRDLAEDLPTMSEIADPDLFRNCRTPVQIQEIQKRLDELKLSEETLTHIMDIMEAEMEKGLSLTRNYEADLKMIPTFVTKFPTGSESDDILSLDLGGSNFRVLFIRLRENEEPIILNKVFIVSESIIKGTGEKLFAHIAHCLFLFMKNHNLDLQRTYPLGFTFSFPCRQHGLANAVLLRWTKGFDCSDVIGENVVELLQKAIDRRGDLKVKVEVLVNDTVGTLMSTSYFDRNAAVGLILGTGCNACYIENVDKIETLEGDEYFGDDKQMIINTEMGAFGENGSIDFIRSRYDEEVDKTSINVGKQIFEKMISGLYLGEIVRLMILDLIDREILFVDEMKRNTYRHALFTKGSFYTKFLSEIESDSNKTFAKTKRIIKELAGIDEPSSDDCSVVKCICNGVSKRAAQLIAAGLAVLIKRVNQPEITIAVDGSLFRFHPRLRLILEMTLKSLIGSSHKFRLVLSTDGSGRGAAVIAAVEAEKHSDVYSTYMTPQPTQPNNKRKTN